MKEQKEHHPPSWARRFIEWYCKPGLVEDLTGDLQEYFERNVKTLGPRRARLIYIIDALKFFRSYTVRKPDFVNPFIHWLMIGNYIKTSRRSLMRNKLFSSINIIGLAISMSVGLLLIAFVLDLRSYDRFHKNGERIYRITNVATFNNREQNGKFASTSIKTGKLIREKVTGVEEVAILRSDFSQDAMVGDHVLPIKGFWAEPSLFRILTFPLLEGNPETALKDPYSIVLTETASKKLFGNEPAVGKAIKFDTLFGMVVFTMEARLKEISIRKLMGASPGNLTFLLSRGFLVLLLLSAIIALPVTYLFFQKFVLIRFPYHSPIRFTELFAGLLAVLSIALLMIGSQTFKAARSNPAVVLKSE